MVNGKTNINVHRSNGNVVIEKNAQSIVDTKENQFINSKYSKKYIYKKACKQRQEKTSRISRPCDEKGKARAFVDNRKDRRKKKPRSSKNSSLAGKKHCGDVCGCKRSRKVEGHDRLRLQQTRQLKKKIGFSIGQSDRMDLISIDPRPLHMSGGLPVEGSTNFDACITIYTIHPKMHTISSTVGP